MYDQWVQAFSDSTDVGRVTSSELEDLRGTRLELTHITGGLLRDYRQTYGFKTTPANLFQLAALVAFILLRHMDNHSQLSRLAVALHRRPSLADSEVRAFEECLRCLLACGAQMVQPRDIARMLYHTAMKLETPLPETVEQMFYVIGETVWHPSDVLRFESCYPNFILSSKIGVERRDCEMDNVLRKGEGLEL